MTSRRQAKRALELHGASLSGYPNVVGLGVGRAAVLEGVDDEEGVRHAGVRGSRLIRTPARQQQQHDPSGDGYRAGRKVQQLHQQPAEEDQDQGEPIRDGAAVANGTGVVHEATSSNGLGRQRGIWVVSQAGSAAGLRDVAGLARNRLGMVGQVGT